MLVKVTTLLLFLVRSIQSTTPPHIVFILADDLGWNDVGFHGSSQIPTPNIDALAYSGRILQNYYVAPICTPSRSALMTGKYPIHTGMQHTVLYGAEARGLLLSEKILPQYLKELGYVNRIVGKWHLGSYKKEFTPLYRGFDSHLGYWTGHQDYFDHTAVETPGFGFDMRINMSLAYDLHGQYSTDIFARESVRIIENHNTSDPLFLYLAHAAVHSANPYNPLPAPNERVDELSYIKPPNRQRFAAMLTKLDDSVGAVVSALAKRQMLQDSIIIFSTDNGGPAAGFNLNAASNYPLRGVKNTLWEGGIRAAGLIWSPLLTVKQKVSKELFHFSDWFPTLLTAAGYRGEFSSGPIDGVDLWATLSTDQPSKRTEILHNIDDIYGNAALMVYPWKLIKGTTYNGEWDQWYGPSGRDSSYHYDIDRIIKSPTGLALRSVNVNLLPEDIVKLRQVADLQCNGTKDNEFTCEPLKENCLFNIEQDPCEYRNVAKENPEILKNLEQVLVKYNRTAVPPGNLPLDPRGNPKYWNYTWTNWGDYLLNPEEISGPQLFQI